MPFGHDPEARNRRCPMPQQPARLRSAIQFDKRSMLEGGMAKDEVNDSMGCKPQAEQRLEVSNVVSASIFEIVKFFVWFYSFTSTIVVALVALAVMPSFSSASGYGLILAIPHLVIIILCGLMASLLWSPKMTKVRKPIFICALCSYVFLLVACVLFWKFC
jgi:hypothetical protein